MGGLGGPRPRGAHGFEGWALTRRVWLHAVSGCTPVLVYTTCPVTRQFWSHACVWLHALSGDTPVSGYTPCLVTRRVWLRASVCLHDVSSYAPCLVTHMPHVN